MGKLKVCFVTSRPRYLILIGLLTALAGWCACATLRRATTHDVLMTCRLAERDASVQLVYEGTYLSRNHGVLVSYRLVGLSELSFAHWYLIPWREVVLSK